MLSIVATTGAKAQGKLDKLCLVKDVMQKNTPTIFVPKSGII